MSGSHPDEDGPGNFTGEVDFGGGPVKFYARTEDARDAVWMGRREWAEFRNRLITLRKLHDEARRLLP
jgi:hypothetical protein